MQQISISKDLNALGYALASSIIYFKGYHIHIRNLKKVLCKDLVGTEIFFSDYRNKCNDSDDIMGIWRKKLLVRIFIGFSLIRVTVETIQGIKEPTQGYLTNVLYVIVQKNILTANITNTFITSERNLAGKRK